MSLRAHEIVYLELPVVELVAVLEEELVGGAEAGLYAVLHHGARARRRRQLLNLNNKVLFFSSVSFKQ